MNSSTGHHGNFIEAPAETSPTRCVTPLTLGPFDSNKSNSNSLGTFPPQITISNDSLSVEDYKKETSFLQCPCSSERDSPRPLISCPQQTRAVSMPLSVEKPSKASYSALKLPSRNSRRSISDNTETSGLHFDIRTLSMSYNEYGDLVHRDASLHPSKVAAELNVNETLRLIDKAYHHDFTTKMRDIIAAHVEYEARKTSGDAVTLQQYPSTWKLVITSPIETTQSSPLLHVSPNVKVFEGPTRVLEIGCSDGAWCFKMKKDHPEWIIEGLDTRDGWSNMRPGTKYGDFMESAGTRDNTDYFGTVHSTSKYPEFTVRDINSILDHDIPIPHYTYSFIRGRDIFGRIESWRSFLNDVRLIVQPDGVVEFMEVDPRPRVHVPRPSSTIHDRKSGPMYDWGDDIASRFKTPADFEIENGSPEWNQRVEERQKATMRPFDGVPAAELKGWLQGTGFWDVKEVVLQLPIGGVTEAGQLLLQEMTHQIELENRIPLLAKKLPQLDLEAIVAKTPYFINFHIVTGRKPKSPRPGDLLLDGSRQEMTASKYETMARYNHGSSNQWMRYENDKKLVSMMKDLSTLDNNLLDKAVHQKTNESNSFKIAGVSVETGAENTRGIARGLGAARGKMVDNSG